MTLFTYRTVAETFAKIDARPDADVQGVYLQVKGLADRGLLAPSHVRGARGANQLPLKEIYRARLLLTLLELGLEGEDLSKASDCLDNGGIWTSSEGKHFDFNLESAIAAPDRWVLALTMGRDRLNDGKLTFRVRLLPEWMASLPINEEFDSYPGGDPTHPDSKAVYLGITHLAYVKIPASQLFADIRGQLDA